MQKHPTARRALTVMGLLLGLVIGAACQGGSAPEADQASGQDTTIDSTPVAEPTPTVVRERSTTQQSATGDPALATPAPSTKAGSANGDAEQSEEPPVTSIRDVDFRNGFRYDPRLHFGASSEPVVVDDGFVEVGQFGSEDYLAFSVGAVVYGDLDGDGIEEAAVETTWNTGGSGLFDSVRVYRLVDGQADLVDAVGYGDRADGGVHNLQIADGLVRVWAFAGGDGACCPNAVYETSLVLGEHTLSQTEFTDPVRWISLDDPETIGELKFIADTNRALLTLSGSRSATTMTFDAAAGQLVELHSVVGPDPASVVLTHTPTGDAVGFDEQVVLSSDGLYELDISFESDRDRSTLFELAIDRQQDSTQVSWTPAIEQVLISDDPLIYSSVAWPVFTSPQPGTAAANDAFGDSVTVLDDLWVADVREFDMQADSGLYEVTYEVLLVTNDLISVRLDYYDYVCCRPYPNYGTRSGVLDLAEGRLVDVGEILDLSRRAEIDALWLSALEAQLGLPSDLVTLEDIAIRSVSLTPEGVELYTDRSDLLGGAGGTTTLLSYDVLGDLVNPELAARAQQ